MVISQSNLAGTKQQGRSCRYSGGGWGDGGGGAVLEETCGKRVTIRYQTVKQFWSCYIFSAPLYLPCLDHRSCYFLFFQQLKKTDKAEKRSRKCPFVNAGKDCFSLGGVKNQCVRTRLLTLHQNITESCFACIQSVCKTPEKILPG